MGRALFIADSSSQLHVAHQVAGRLRDRLGWQLEGNLVPGRAAPSARQVREAGIGCPLRTMSIEELCRSEALLRFDALVAFLPGSRLHALLTRLEQLVARTRPARRPVTITGYNGVVYERQLEGLLWRTGCDFIALSSRSDHALFARELEQLGYEGSRLVTTGLVVAQPETRRPFVPYEERANKDVLFATQAVVPSTAAEREYILDRLKELAERHRERKVYVKPRTRPGERTFHVEKHHYESLAERRFGGRLPPNLVFDYRPLSTLLDEVGLVVTVSSTAVIEAIGRGVPGAVLTDFGLKESLGNHFFRHSGLLTTLPALTRGEVPRPHVPWMREHGLGEESLDRLVEAVEAFTAHQARAGRSAPIPPRFYDADTAPFVHARSSRDAPSRPTQPNARSPLEAAYRKTRKLVKNPLRFFTDMLERRARARP